MLASLDGFVEGPNGMDWVIADAELHDYSAAQLRSADAILFGRVTYQLFVD
jgi:dihydrofolate reductase